MRHKVHGRKLGRTSSHRKALINNLCCSLIRSNRIVTTTAKAKELRQFIEPMITRAKEDTENNRRLIFKRIRNTKLIDKLFEEIAPRFKNRPGGYTRILKLSTPRAGDNADMAFIEFVEEFEGSVKPQDIHEAIEKSMVEMESKLSSTASAKESVEIVPETTDPESTLKAETTDSNSSSTAPAEEKKD